MPEELHQVDDEKRLCAECANFRRAPKTWPELTWYLVVHPRSLALAAMAAVVVEYFACRKLL